MVKWQLRGVLRDVVALFCLALALASAGAAAHRSKAVMGCCIDWCEADWVKSSSFWRWYFNCDGDNGTPPAAPKEEKPEGEKPV
jgi:hypothetical protein